MGTYYDRIKIALTGIADKVDPEGATKEDGFYDDVPESLERIAANFEPGSGGGGGGTSGVQFIKLFDPTPPVPSADGLTYEEADLICASHTFSRISCDVFLLDVDPTSNIYFFDDGGYKVITFWERLELAPPEVEPDPQGESLALATACTAWWIQGDDVLCLPTTAQFYRTAAQFDRTATPVAD